MSTLLTVNSRPLMADLASALEFVKSPAILIFSFIEMLLVPLAAKLTVRVFSVELKTIVDAPLPRVHLRFVIINTEIWFFTLVRVDHKLIFGSYCSGIWCVC